MQSRPRFYPNFGGFFVSHFGDILGHFGTFLGVKTLLACKFANIFAVPKRNQHTTIMANLYLFHDKRSPRKDGSCPLKLALCHKRATVYSSIDVAVKPGEWDAEKNQIILRPDKKFLNVLLKKKIADTSVALSRIELRSDFDALTARQVLDMIVRGTDTLDTTDSLDYVLPVYNEYIAVCKKGSTASCYRTSLKNLIEYEPDIDTFRFKDINVAWLRKYQCWLTDGKDGRGMAVNGANVYLRNLRTIFNFAISNEYTHARYPFRDIDMTTTEPDKFSIPYEKFIEWAAKPMPDQREFYRDLFMLSFFLCGIRPVDLLHVKKSQVRDGRLVYWPQKLNGRTKLSIKIEPEAWALIKKYEGKEYLINVMESRTDYRTFCGYWNRAIKAIGTDELIPTVGKDGKNYTSTKHHGIVPYITIYYARTCWATYAYNVLQLPMDIISQALGHKSGLKVTNFYVKRDPVFVDNANRDLIDRVTKDISERAGTI